MLSYNSIFICIQCPPNEQIKRIAFQTYDLPQYHAAARSEVEVIPTVHRRIIIGRIRLLLMRSHGDEIEWDWIALHDERPQEKFVPITATAI